MIKNNFAFILIFIFALLSFSSAREKKFVFSYPNVENTKIQMIAKHIDSFKKDWQGLDYLYKAKVEKFIYTVTYHKANLKEKKLYIDKFKLKPNYVDNSPAYAASYFNANYSSVRTKQKNEIFWGKYGDDFLYRQYDYTIGTDFNQKYMESFATLNNEFFVWIYISKTDCTSSDSMEMREIMDGLKKL